RGDLCQELAGERRIAKRALLAAGSHCTSLVTSSRGPAWNARRGRAARRRTPCRILLQLRRQRASLRAADGIRSGRNAEWFRQDSALQNDRGLVPPGRRGVQL